MDFPSCTKVPLFLAFSQFEIPKKIMLFCLLKESGKKLALMPQCFLHIIKGPDNHFHPGSSRAEILTNSLLLSFPVWYRYSHMRNTLILWSPVTKLTIYYYLLECNAHPFRWILAEKVGCALHSMVPYIRVNMVMKEPETLLALWESSKEWLVRTQQGQLWVSSPWGERQSLSPTNAIDSLIPDRSTHK